MTSLFSGNARVSADDEDEGQVQKTPRGHRSAEESEDEDVPFHRPTIAIPGLTIPDPEDDAEVAREGREGEGDESSASGEDTLSNSNREAGRTGNTVRQSMQPAQPQPARSAKSAADDVNRTGSGRRPTVIFKRKEAKAAEAQKQAEETFIYPSPRFTSEFQPWRLRIGDVTLLQDSLGSLVARHPDCRRIQSAWDGITQSAACSDTARFLAEGDEVIFTYAKANEVLTGASYRFMSQFRAVHFAESIRQTLIDAGRPVYVQLFSASGEPVAALSGAEARSREPVAVAPGQSILIDSDMFSVSVHPAERGWLVSVNAYFQDRIQDAEAYAKAKLLKIEFGNLTIGSTKKDAMPELPKSCSDVTSPEDKISGRVAEYYGICFDFPYEAHMQLQFNEATGILEAAALSPIGAATGGILDAMLTKKFGLAQSCRRIDTDMTLRAVKSEVQRGKPRVTRMRKRSAAVYAGTCENPIVYSSDMRFVFENRFLNRDDIAWNFNHRLDAVAATVDHERAFEARKDAVKSFFE